MGHRGLHVIVEVEELNGDIDGVERERHKEHILERTLCVLGLIGGEPLLKQGRERMTIDDLLRTV